MKSAGKGMRAYPFSFVNGREETEMNSSLAKQKKKWDMLTGVIWIISLVAYSVLMYILFYRQTIHTGQWFESDIDAYLLKMQGLDSGFDFPYPVYFMVGRFFMLFTNVKVAAAIATTLMNSLGVAVLGYYMTRTLREHYEIFYKRRAGDGLGHLNRKWVPFLEILIIVLTFSVFFVSMLYAPKGVYLPGMDHKYLGVFSPNPIHNQTYLATRPFAIAAFFIFARILTYYEKKTNWKDYLLFSAFLLLTTMTKPSFTLVFVSAAGVILLARLIWSGLKTFQKTCLLAVCFVPTLIALLYQFGGVFGKHSHAGAEGGIGFGVGAAWSVYTHNIVLAVMLALAFPGFTMLLNLKRLKTDTLYRFSWEVMVAGFLEFLCLYEKGERFVHLNFSWGYMHGIFFVFVASVILLVQNTLEKRQKWYALTAEWLLFFWQLICGIIYFLYIYSGQFYYSF